MLRINRFCFSPNKDQFKILMLNVKFQEFYCYLQDLFVQTDNRAKGCGKSLIEAIYAEAHKKNCSRVYWLTQETNYQARILYDQVAINTGFIQYRKNLV